MKLLKLTQDTGVIEMDGDLEESIMESAGKVRYTWVEKSFIFQFPLRYYFMENNTYHKISPSFNMFFNGFPFFVFLFIGAVFGVFFKKTMDMERRAAMYTGIVGVMIIFLANFAYG